MIIQTKTGTSITRRTTYSGAVRTAKHGGVCTVERTTLMRTAAKRAATLLLALVTAFGAFGGTAFAAYSDLEGHWSKESMEAMAARGLLQGYEDGTMRPEGSITVAEALTILSRLFVADQATLTQIKSEFGAISLDILRSKKEGTPNPEWVADALSICLAADVVLDNAVHDYSGRNEVRTGDFNRPIQKQVLALFLSRAILPEESIANAVLNFTDAEQITANYALYAPYIAKLKELGILEGDEQGRFNPGSNVTRAVAATMVANAAAWRETKYGSQRSLNASAAATPTPSGGIEGIITEYKDGVLVLTGFDGIPGAYVVPADLPTKPTDAQKGRFATLKLDAAGKVAALSIDNTATWYQGQMTRISTSGNVPTVVLQDVSTATASYQVAQNAAISVNGTAIGAERLSAEVTGKFVSVKLTDGMIVAELRAYDGNHTLTGTVNDIYIDVLSKLTLTSDNTTEPIIQVLSMYTSFPPEVVRGGLEISLDRIRKGDSAIVEVRGGRIIKVTLSSRELVDKGEVTEIIRTATVDKITVKSESDYQNTYELDRYARILKAGVEISIGELEIGDAVSLSLSGQTITEVYVEKSLTSSNLRGTLVTVDTTKREIVLRADGVLNYITVPTTAKITDAITTLEIRFGSIPTGATLTVFGESQSAGRFTASQIIVET